MADINLDPSRQTLGWLVRHGELNITDRWDGWGDFVLSPEGRQAAEKAGQWLAFEKIGRIVASDLPRTLQTAEIIMNSVDISCPYLATDPCLRAWAIGDFTGKTKTPERKDALQHYRDNPDEVVPGGESWHAFQQRVQVAFQYLCAPYNGRPTAIVTHNSVLKALFNLDEKGDLIKEGGIVRVDIDDKGEIHFVAVMGSTPMDNGIMDASCG